MIIPRYRSIAGMAALCLVSALFVFPARAEDAAPPPAKFYKYAHNDAEYTVLLPEAPSVKTIWPDGTTEKNPYMKISPESGAAGEIATFKRVDTDTGESFEVKITFLKAEHDFLATLTRKGMHDVLENDFKGTALDMKEPLKNKTLDFSMGAKSGMKWATISGFTTDDDNSSLYNVEHYLTGQQSILVIKIQYSLENKIFADYYKALTDSITYRPL